MIKRSGFILVLTWTLTLQGCSVSTYVVRKQIDLTVGSQVMKEVNAYCDAAQPTAGLATGGGCSMGSPHNGWAVVRCDPIGLGDSGFPNISPSTGQRAIGWRMSIAGPAGTTPSSAALFAVCAQQN